MGRHTTLIWIAKTAGYDPHSLSVRQAFNWAARKLADEELIEIYYLDVPTAVSAHCAPTNRRDVVCATRYGYGEQLTDEDCDVRREACEEIYALASILRDAFSKEFSQ